LVEQKGGAIGDALKVLQVLFGHMQEGRRSRRRLRKVQALAEHNLVTLRAVTNDGGKFSHLTCNYANQASLVGRALLAAVRKAPQTPLRLVSDGW
jgi:hypothetical protein